jgi:hypothetical protein
MFGDTRTAAYSFCNLPKKELSMAANVKQELPRLADALPENSACNNAIEESCFRRAVEAGIRAADRDAFATDEEILVALALWA